MVIGLLAITFIVSWGVFFEDFIQAESRTVPLYSEYENRKAALPGRATQPFMDDPLRNVETDLDRRPFDQINLLDCPKLINNANGWSVEARTGGRPFMNFDNIQVNGTPIPFTPCTQGSSVITPIEINNHYTDGKSVNRLWFTHKASNGYPIVVVMTPDGFFNVGGAKPPLLQGAATRIGFIGEPFGNGDYVQHVDEVNIVEVDNDTLTVIYNIHSEAGEGVLEIVLKWISTSEQPELHFRSAHVSRLDAKLGFVGFNFMRGPTLSGLLSEFGTPEKGIEAFHDGRTIFLISPNGTVVHHNRLIPPVITNTVIRQDIATNVLSGTKLIMDQPQNVENYFSKFPTPGYEERTDLVLTLRDHSDSAKSVTVRRAQITVDLDSTNPEANETVNVFYAADLVIDKLNEFTFTLELAARDFEELYGASASVVFVSDRSESRPRLYFLPLDADFKPAGPVEPLTDEVITDPRRPSISADSRFVIFDADDYRVSTRQRIYTLDLKTAAVRRLAVDPFSGVSYDLESSLNTSRTHFTMITNRPGTPSRLNIQEVTSGLGSGTGNSVATASSADWSHSHTRNEIAYADSTGLWLLDVETNDKTKLVSGTNIRDVKFAPCAAVRIAYVADNGLNVVNRDGSGNESILPDGDHPAWIDKDHLIIHRNVGGNTDLYLVNLDTKQTTRLTTDPAADTEPAANSYCIYLPIILKDY